jgi:hypothetical protein
MHYKRSSTPSFTYVIGLSIDRVNVHVVTVKAERERGHELLPKLPQQQRGLIETNLTAPGPAAPMPTEFFGGRRSSV